METQNTNDPKVELLKSLGSLVTIEDFKAIFQRILEVIAEGKQGLDTHVKTSVAQAVSDIQEKFKEFETEAREGNSSISKKLTKNIEEQTSELRDMLSKALGLLDGANAVKAPEVDYSKVADIAKETVLPLIPEQVEQIKETPESIRDALETLEGDDRLDKSAIKGLDEEFAKLKTRAQEFFVGGIRYLKELADIIITSPTNGQVLTYDSTLKKWKNADATGGGAVDSVFGRTGAVTPAAGDYTATQITNTPAGNISAVTVQAALNELDTEKQGALTLTTTGSSGAATLVGSTLNIPQYLSGSGDMILASTQTNSGLKTFLDGTFGLRNVANTFTGLFTNTITAARTWTFPDKNGTVAMTSDITGTNSGTNTGDVSLAGAPNYITIAGQTITRALVDLTTHITGKLPFSNIADVATGTVMYRKTAATGSIEAQTLATLKTDLGLTGTNSGDQTITLTGDVTGSGTGSFAATLANTAVTPGSYTLANVTVDAKGRITAASNGSAGAGTVTNVSSADANATVATGSTTPIITVVSAPKLATGRTISLTGDIAYTSPSFDGSSNVTAASTLATVNTNVGSFGSASSVATFTANAKGLITAAANAAISITSSAVSDFSSAVAALITGKEDTSNKSTSVTTDQASNTKYPSVKSVYDWATGAFATIANLALKAPLASPTFTGTVTVPTPVNDTDAASKGYVDTVAQGLSAKPSAIVATTAALPTNTYSNGASGVGATLTAVAVGVLTIDGYSVALNDYVLVKNEVAGANNGLYKCTVAGTAGVAYVLTRAVEMDKNTEFSGGFVFIESGTTNGASGWVCTNTGSVTVGTTAITFTQFSGAGEITVDSTIVKTGNQLKRAPITGDVSIADGSNASTVTKINGTALSGLATGILKNTTATGVPSIAVAADFPILNQNTTGTAANVTGTVAVANGGTGVTTSTGTGSVVLGTSPTLVTPVIGAATGTSLVVSSKIDEAKGADIASATTTDIGAATGNYVNVTGTTTITGLGTVQAGTRRIVNFTGSLILTHNATSLILPSAANITTAAGDTAVFVSLGSGNWKCVSYDRASGAALTSSGGGSWATISSYTDSTYDYTSKTFSSIPSSYKSIRLVGMLELGSYGGTVGLILGGSTSYSVNSRRTYLNATAMTSYQSGGALAQVNLGDESAGYLHYIDITITNPSGAKPVIIGTLSHVGNNGDYDYTINAKSNVNGQFTSITLACGHNIGGQTSLQLLGLT